MPSADQPYPRPPLALIVTGQEWTALSVITIFAPRGYATLRVATGAQVMEYVADARVDLVIAERHLKDMTGMELAACLRESRAGVPSLILSTASWQREDRLAALEAGAWDVCSLPMDGEELFLRVDAWVRRKLHGDAVSDLGLLDAETGLYNRQGLQRRLEEIGASAVRYGRPMACVVVEAPELSAGEGPDAAGALAALLRQAGRASDTIGRLSRTEFVVMAPDTDLDGVRGMVDRLRRAVESARLAGRADTRLRFGCCALPATRRGGAGAGELLTRALEALKHDPFPDPARTPAVHSAAW